MFPAQFQRLSAYSQFILYKITNDRMGVKKLPISPHTFLTCDITDPNHWSTLKHCLEIIKGSHLGIAFVLTPNDPFFLLDIDDCLLTQGGWNDIALEAIDKFQNQTGIEISSSGRGLHIIGELNKEDFKHSCKNRIFHTELYTKDRFIALTGNLLNQTPIGDCHTQITEYANIYFSPKGGTDNPHALEWHDYPRDDWSGPQDDEILLQRALKSKSYASTIGKKASFADLWTAKIEVLNKAFPPNPNSLSPYDASLADAALTQHLAFWTGCDHARMYNLLKQSALIRDKWDRPNYLENTILNACAQQVKVLGDKAVQKVITTPLHGGPTLLTGETYLNAMAQIDLFKGCVYVTSRHEILVPGGQLLNPEKFKAHFRGFTFLLNDDRDNPKITRNAWKAFIDSQIFKCPDAENVIFLPKEDPGKVINIDGIYYANSYYPADVPCKKGEITLFLNHLHKLCPDPIDFKILINYLAAIVQYPGVKFNYCIVLQGTQGNGKSLISKVIMHAIGKKYYHSLKPSKIDSKFNSWMNEKIFVSIEDIYTTKDHKTILEELKPLITEEIQEIEPKGHNQYITNVCFNLIINSNHKEGILKSNNDRRYAIFFTPQQTSEDLIIWNMGEDYFNTLMGWLETQEGYAYCTHFLKHYPIEETYNPATLCLRAPITTSTAEAIEVSRDPIELIVQEAIDADQVGFRGGWVSSFALSKLLEDKRCAHRLTNKNKPLLMERLGYVIHPALKDGRTTKIIDVEKGRPRLYVKKGHPSYYLTDPNNITYAYLKSQSNIE